eukprot:scaffold15968_cov46-Cyclotella_meneghiniana.AAC.3
MRRSRKAALSKGDCEGSEDFDAVGSVKVVEPDVVGDADGLGVGLPLSERPISVLERFSRKCSFTLSLCSNKVTHERISCGNGAISKCWGICLGQCNKSEPLDVVDKLILDTDIGKMAADLGSDFSFFWIKITICFQWPSEVELSVMLRIQSSGCRVPSMTSIHTVTCLQCAPGDCLLPFFCLLPQPHHSVASYIPNQTIQYNTRTAFSLGIETLEPLSVNHTLNNFP